jgi:hypothetical protein
MKRKMNILEVLIWLTMIAGGLALTWMLIASGEFQRALAALPQHTN